MRPNTYHDSVVLMAISREAGQVPGVRSAIAVMGTAMNKDFLARVDLLDATARVAGAEDLIIGIDAVDEEAISRALQVVEERLRERGGPRQSGARQQPPRTIASALRDAADANLALVSVPGEFAAREARQALAAGLHVLLYSDNVSVADEVALKRLAADQGLLCMGPDCGSAIIDGVGLGFANTVRSGPVGIVAASGTGLQEVACLVDRLGSGISHAIGIGGRDLSGAVGGLAAGQAIRMLAADPGTRCIVLVSKPPDQTVAQAVLANLRQAGKLAVACFVGADRGAYQWDEVIFAPTLQAAAESAVTALAGARARIWPEDDLINGVGRIARAMGSGQRYVRGLFTGGTLCGEAAALLTRLLGPVCTNTARDPARRVEGGAASREHTLWDLGDDYFTVGRPHPMIEPALRLDHLAREAADPEVAVILVDVVLGHGAHPDPAGVLAPGIRAALEQAGADGRSLAVVASVTGTESDPQRLSAQVAHLRKAGALVAPTAALAATAAAAIAARQPHLLEKGE